MAPDVQTPYIERLKDEINNMEKALARYRELLALVEANPVVEKFLTLLNNY
jgi:hypothetical protein